MKWGIVPIRVLYKAHAQAHNVYNCAKSCSKWASLDHIGLCVMSPVDPPQHFTVPEPFANGLAEFPEDSYVVLGASFSRACAYCGTLQKCEGS